MGVVKVLPKAKADDSIMLIQLGDEPMFGKIRGHWKSKGVELLYV